MQKQHQQQITGKTAILLVNDQTQTKSIMCEQEHRIGIK